jgi:hypothetical protein
MTMNDKPKDDKDERVEDLDMPESESEDVKGGYSKIELDYRPPKPTRGSDK